MKRVAVFLAIILFFPHSLVRANVIINEVMYDLDGADIGREWIELYNDGSSPVDISNYKLFESGVNHKLTLFQGDKNISSFGYAIITSDKLKFKNDWPNFNGTIFDSTFSLSNTGEALGIKDIPISVKDIDTTIKDMEQNIVDKFSYSSNLGGAGDGKSLQKVAGIWIASRPTPGLENKIFTEPKKPAVSAPVKIKNIPKVATAILSDTGDVDKVVASPKVLIQNENNTYHRGFVFIFFIILLGAGGWAVYVIRGNKNNNNGDKKGEDFEILDY